MRGNRFGVRALREIGHSGSHDNTASLNGDIRMGVYGGVALTVGDSFTILTVENTRSGSLNNLKPAMWDITYPAKDVVATLINSLGTFDNSSQISIPGTLVRIG